MSGVHPSEDRDESVSDYFDETPETRRARLLQLAALALAHAVSTSDPMAQEDYLRIAKGLVDVAATVKPLGEQT